MLGTKLLLLETDKYGPLTLSQIKFGGAEWEAFEDFHEIVVPETHELVVRKTGRLIEIFRRTKEP